MLSPDPQEFYKQQYRLDYVGHTKDDAQMQTKRLQVLPAIGC